MKLNIFYVIGMTLFFFLGCAKISPSDASRMSTAELCKVLMGAAVPPKDRRTVNAEIQYRGISCREESAQTEFDQQRDMNRRRPADY